jgi:hypothetical protein
VAIVRTYLIKAASAKKVSRMTEIGHFWQPFLDQSKRAQLLVASGAFSIQNFPAFWIEKMSQPIDLSALIG